MWTANDAARSPQLPPSNGSQKNRAASNNIEQTAYLLHEHFCRDPGNANWRTYPEHGLYRITALTPRNGVLTASIELRLSKSAVTEQGLEACAKEAIGEIQEEIRDFGDRCALPPTQVATRISIATIEPGTPPRIEERDSVNTVLQLRSEGASPTIAETQAAALKYLGRTHERGQPRGVMEWSTIDVGDQQIEYRVREAGVRDGRTVEIKLQGRGADIVDMPSPEVRAQIEPLVESACRAVLGRVGWPEVSLSFEWWRYGPPKNGNNRDEDY